MIQEIGILEYVIDRMFELNADNYEGVDHM